MKKFVLPILLLLLTNKVEAQDINLQSEYNKIFFPINLNVGGGITGDDYYYKRLTLFHGNAISFETGTNGPNYLFTRMYIDPSGNIGVGTCNPLNLVDIYSPSKPVMRLFTDNISGQGNPQIVLCRGNEQTLKLEGYPNVEGRISAVVGNVGFLTFYTGNNQEKLRIDASGNLGIGTTSPQNKLDVNGTIHAREVKVDLTGWSDFVFAPSYKLRPLSEIELYIKANGKLPEIPSASEVEQNGVNVGDMQAKLLQKVEELTLYLIEQQKTIALQQQQIIEMKEEITKLNLK